MVGVIETESDIGGKLEEAISPSRLNEQQSEMVKNWCAITIRHHSIFLRKCYKYRNE